MNGDNTIGGPNPFFPLSLHMIFITHCFFFCKIYFTLSRQPRMHIINMNLHGSNMGIIPLILLY